MPFFSLEIRSFPMGPRDQVTPVIFYKSATMASAPAAEPRKKKPYIRRRGDRSQQWRLATQILFGAITLVVGVQFYVWVRFYETAGESLRVSRPPGVEAWLPIAALMNIKWLVMTWTVPEIHPAGMFMLVAFIAISLVFRKSFCSWICPVGTLSEWLWQSGEAVFGRNLELPRWADIPLRSLKYVLLGLFAYVVVTMPAPDIHAFLASPYGLIADVKMLDFFRRMGQTTAIVLFVLIVLSVVVKNVWCRYLCPYGALMGIVALVSPTRIRRNPDACIDCAKCARACPAGLPVDRALVIRSAECTACMSCVAVCPAVGALELRAGLRRRNAVLTPARLAAGIVILFLAIVRYARATGHWHTPLPDETFFELIPRAGELQHPR